MNGICALDSKKAAYFTLGCKLNFAETSSMGNELATLGICKAISDERADVCIINTCSVTELADKKSRQLIRRTIKTHPGAFIIVTGCYAQLKPDEVAQIEGVDFVLGTDQKKDIPTIIVSVARAGGHPSFSGVFPSPSGNDPSPSGVRRMDDVVIISSVEDMLTFTPACSTDDRTRHFLKVQDGCDYCCTYCTVPLARGRSRSGCIADIIKQAEWIADKGGKEIVLTGVNTGDFGKIFQKTVSHPSLINGITKETFLDLLKALDKVQGIERYRISSIEPNLITDEIISFVADSARFMPHFHIPLQSGSDTVLKLMRRRYDTVLFRKKTELIKKRMPDAFIGVDVIVGMRGETDALFKESKTFIENIPFSQLHVFSYSERPSTQALKITPAVPPDIKSERSKQLLYLSEERLYDFYNAHIGKTARTLFEHARKGKNMVGFSENYIKVEIPYQKAFCNTIHTIRMTGWNEGKTALRAIMGCDEEKMTL